ncbi:hypothetical protein A5731_22640 [Mycolicibacterium conceptionense]|nr:hypothetical protein A5718_07900 [Mycolicibacterium conceptionense]OBE98497.1 hypothetical protein A5731_22640 [Mycolicibacterium conceptionense]
MITVTDSDGTRYAISVDHGIARMTRSTSWSTSTWQLDPVTAQCLADAINDELDRVSEVTRSY